MSGVFPDREKAFEDKWAHDEELRFRVLARRNKLLGLWAAGEMGLTAPQADEFATVIVRAELEKAGDESVFQALHAAFAEAKVPRTDHLIRLKMDEFLTAAKAELMSSGG
jgi:hypothetical protein